MPTTNPESSQAPRKRTLSTKAATNGDPNAERKRKKLEHEQKKTAKAAVTRKQKPTTVAPKKKTAAGRAATATKKATQHSSVDVEDVDNNASHQTNTQATNLNGEESDDSDVDMYCGPAADPINVDDEETENLEAPEESAEAELSMWLSSFFSH
jgi:hypothetical protein